MTLMLITVFVGLLLIYCFERAAMEDTKGLRIALFIIGALIIASLLNYIIWGELF